MVVASRMSSLRDLTFKDIYLWLLCLIGFFSCVPVVTFFGTSFYKILLLIVAIYLVITNRLILGKTGVQVYSALSLITFLITVVRLPSFYVSTDLQGLISILLIAMVAPALSGDSDASSNLIKGVILGGKANVVWILIQVISWWLLSIDINDLLFRQTLGMVETASQFKATGFVATGFCWNVGGIAAALLLTFMVENKPFWKILTFSAGVLTQSSTVLFGLVLCAAFMILRCSFGKARFSINRFSVSWLFYIVGFLFLIVFTYNAFPIVRKVVKNALSFTFFRFGALNGHNMYDSSAQAHSDYIANIPALLENMDLKSLIFGYGINCSGLPYSTLTGQYSALGAWTVECDLTNTLLSMGLAGTIMFYAWLFSGIFRTWKTDKNWSFLLCVFMVCGLFYNLQSVNSFWLVLCEAAIISYSKYSSKEIFNS